jgi:hypothetical protein
MTKLLTTDEVSGMTGRMWETLKGKWSYIADWESAKREAVERVAEFTRMKLRELPFQSGSNVEEGLDCVDDRDEF